MTNMAGQNTAGWGASTATSVNTIDAARDQPDTMKSAPGCRRATAVAMRPPSSVPAKPATTRSRPNVADALPSGRPRSRTKYVGIHVARPPMVNV